MRAHLGRVGLGVGAGLLALTVWVAVPHGAAAAEEETVESCVSCHRDPDFLVTDKKLHDYFQQWESSIHAQEGVSCSDCHGGHPDAAAKEAAHEGMATSSGPDSAINFRNIPRTCGQCHEEIYDAYRESPHSEHLIKEEGEQQGPNCVTCHGSLNVEALNVATVRKACVRCHNEKTENSPEIPDEAEELLNQFLSIHRYYRYISIRAEPEDSAKFFRFVDPEVERLSLTWHTFDLEAIEARTKIVLLLMKTKREAVRALRRSGEAAEGAAARSQ